MSAPEGEDPRPERSRYDTRWPRPDLAGTPWPDGREERAEEDARRAAERQALAADAEVTQTWGWAWSAIASTAALILSVTAVALVVATR